MRDAQPGSQHAAVPQVRRGASQRRSRRHRVPHHRRAAVPRRRRRRPGHVPALDWYAARREGLHLDGAADEFSTRERVEKALRAVAPKLRLIHTDQQELAAYAAVARFGADEILLHSGEVPTAMAFLVAGRVRLTATVDDGSLISVGTLEEGAFLGQTALTRQPVLAGAYALDEVTVLQIDRAHMEELVLRKPLLLQEIGRAIEDRRANVLRAVAAVED